MARFEENRKPWILCLKNTLKLSFRDGIVWKVEIKLYFQIPQHIVDNDNLKMLPH